MSLARHVSPTYLPHLACPHALYKSPSTAYCIKCLTVKLRQQINPDSIIKQLRSNPEESWKQNIHTENVVSCVTPYSTRYASKEDIPKFRIPRDGAPAEAIRQILEDELDLDGRPNLNLARLLPPPQNLRLPM